MEAKFQGLVVEDRIGGAKGTVVEEAVEKNKRMAEEG